MWTSDTQVAPPLPLAGASKRRRHGLSADDRLARLVAEGDEQAFAILYQRYYQRLYRYCRSLLHNDADAQDALQAAWTGAYTALRERRRDAPMRPWLYRIAYNESISIMRRWRPDVALLEVNETPTASAEQIAAERARLALLMSDLRELTERQRGALVMRELGGLAHEEIAVAFGISVGAAKQTIFEARASLAEFAKGRDMACEDVCRAVSDGNGRTLRGRQVRAHLRDCASCSAFAATIPVRSRDLRAIAPPISLVAATSLLRRALAAGSGHSGASTTAAGAAGAGTAATGAAGTGTATTSIVGGATAAGAVTKVAGIAISAKTIAGIVVLATAAAGVTGAAVSGLGANTSRPPAKPKLHSRTVAPARPSGRVRQVSAVSGRSTSVLHASRTGAHRHAQTSAGNRHAGASTRSTSQGAAVRAAPSRGKSTAAKTRTSTPAPPATVHKSGGPTPAHQPAKQPPAQQPVKQPANQPAHQPQSTKTGSGSTQAYTSPATHGSVSSGARNTAAAQPPAAAGAHPKPAGP